MWGFDSEVHLSEHPSQLLTIGQVGLLAGQKVTPPFFLLKSLREFLIHLIFSKETKNLSSCTTILRHSLGDISKHECSPSLVLYGELPLFLSPTGGAEATRLCCSQQETCIKNSTLACLPRNDSKSLHYFPSLFCQLAFTTCVYVLLHW